MIPQAVDPFAHRRVFEQLSLPMRDLGLQFLVMTQVVGKLCKSFFALFPQRMVGVFDHFVQQLIQAIDDGISQFFVKARPAHDCVGPFLNHFADEMFIGLERCRRPFYDTVEHGDMPPFADHRAQQLPKQRRDIKLIKLFAYCALGNAAEAFIIQCRDDITHQPRCTHAHATFAA